MAVGVNIVSTFDSKGISRAISDFKKLDGAGNKATFGLRTLDKGLSNTLASVGKVAAGQELNLGVTLCFLVYHQFFELISRRFTC